MDSQRIPSVSEELCNALAYQQAVIDAHRIARGMPPLGTRFQFTREQLRQGAAMGPRAMILDTGTLIVRLES